MKGFLAVAFVMLSGSALAADPFPTPPPVPTIPAALRASAASFKAQVDAAEARIDMSRISPAAEARIDLLQSRADAFLNGIINAPH